jgi:hypothetical protein
MNAAITGRLTAQMPYLTARLEVDRQQLNLKTVRHAE